MITRQEYKEARRFIRAQDSLKERADVVAWCKREGISYNFHHLARH